MLRAMPKLAEKIAIVTGAGQGVGRGIALALAAEGARIAVAGRTLSKCETVAGEIEAAGGDAIALRCDTTSREDVDACVEAVRSKWERIDILVNNAQSMVYRSLRRLSESDIELMWQSGPMGSFRFMQACFEALREAGGSVVNVASGSSIAPQPAMGGYAMAKEATRVLTRAAAVEWGAHGIRVNAICPLAESPGLQSFASDLGTTVEEAVMPGIPLRRLGDPQLDIGQAVAFLCSDEAAYVTGTTLMVDGGHVHLR